MVKTELSPPPPQGVRIGDALQRWLNDNAEWLNRVPGVGMIPIRITFNIERGDIKVQLGV